MNEINLFLKLKSEVMLAALQDLGNGIPCHSSIVIESIRVILFFLRKTPHLQKSMKNKKSSFYSDISTHLKNIISKQAASSHKKQKNEK